MTPPGDRDVTTKYAAPVAEPWVDPGGDARDTTAPAAARDAAPSETRTGTATLLAYSLPSLTSALMFGTVSMYLLKYSTDVLLIPPAVIGLVFGLSRIYDAITDPAVGYLSDRTRTRLGRRRPWMLASAVPLGLAYYAIWAPPASLEGQALMLWISVAIFLFYTFTTTFGVPYNAFGAEIATGYHDRTRVFGAKAFADHLGIILAAAMILALERSESPRSMASFLAVGAALAVSASIVWPSLVLRERAEYQARASQKNAYRAFWDVLTNPHARLLLAVFFVETLGFQAVVSLLPFLTEYVLGNPGATGFYLFGAIGSTLVTIPIWLPLSRRFGKARVWTASLAGKGVLFLALAFVGPGDTWLVGAVTVLFGVLTGSGAVLGPSLQADVIDTDEARTGERKEGTFFAAWGFAVKGAIGASLLISGVVLDVSGFVPNAEQSESALRGLRLLTSAIPLVLHAVAVLLMLRFSLDAAQLAAIRRTGGAGDEAQRSRTDGV